MRIYSAPYTFILIITWGLIPLSSFPVSTGHHTYLLQYQWLYSGCCTWHPHDYSVTTSLHFSIPSPFFTWPLYLLFSVWVYFCLCIQKFLILLFSCLPCFHGEICRHWNITSTPPCHVPIISRDNSDSYLVFNSRFPASMYGFQRLICLRKSFASKFSLPTLPATHFSSERHTSLPPSLSAILEHLLDWGKLRSTTQRDILKYWRWETS